MKKNIILFGLVMLMLSSFVNAGLTTDITSYWKFDGNATDSANSYDGTVDGATQTSSGKINQAYSFDGTNDIINTSLISATGDKSISFWVYPEQTGVFQHLVASGNTLNNDVNGISIVMRDTNTITAIIGDGVSVNHHITITGSTVLSTDTWYFIVVVFDDTTSLKIYVDGSLEGTSTTFQNTETQGTGLSFGRSTLNSDFSFQGRIDEPAIWNRILNTTEISNLYNSGNGFQYPFSTVYNFTITAEDIYDSSSLTDFEAYIFGDICKQEFANISTYCGGLNTGDYKYNSSEWDNLNFVDGDFSTRSTTNILEVTERIYVNYTIPVLAGINSKWEIKDGTDRRNLTLTSCDTSLDKYIFRYNLIAFAASGGPSWQCWNGSSFIFLYRPPTQGGGQYIYEEKMNWDFNKYNDSGTGTITTDILDNDTSTYNITIVKTDYSNRTYADYNVSANLNAILTGTNITFNVYLDGLILVNISNVTLLDTNNSLSFYSTYGTFNINPTPGETLVFQLSDNQSIFTPKNFTYNFNSTQIATFNLTVDAIKNVVNFQDATNGSAISGASITVYYPNGDTITRTTNSTGHINFSYISSSNIQSGNYTFEFSKSGYTLLNLTKSVTSSELPFTETYNISRANININIYDRETGSLLSGTNVSVIVLTLLNQTTNNGTVTIDNVSIVSGSYTVQAIADGYGTEQQTFTYTAQENITVNLYLLNLTGANTGTLYVNTVDSFYRNLQGSQVTLMEYDPGELSFIEVSESLTNSNGESQFFIELNVKTYYIRATKTIDGVLYSATTNPEGEIIVTDEEVRNLILYYSEEFNINPEGNLVYDITETFVNNVSTISVDFYTLDGLAETVCIEYFRTSYNSEVSVTNDTYCLEASSALQNLAGPNILLNRSNSYLARVYIDRTTYDIVLEEFRYPSISDTEEIFDDDTIGALIVMMWIFSLAMLLYMKNVTLWFFISILLAWTQLVIFPTYSIVFVAVFKTVISVLALNVSRKQRDTE